MERLWRALAAAAILFLSGCAGTPDGVRKTPPSPLPRATVTGSGGMTTGPLRVERIELAFGNGRGEITVPRRGEVRPEAVIRFRGNGMLRAAWVADGRTIEQVSLPVTFGDTLLLLPAEGTVFPTFEPGPHAVTLRVIEPAPSFTPPSVTYFVTGEERER